MNSICVLWGNKTFKLAESARNIARPGGSPSRQHKEGQLLGKVSNRDSLQGYEGLKYSFTMPHKQCTQHITFYSLNNGSTDFMQPDCIGGLYIGPTTPEQHEHKLMLEL